MKIMLGTTIGLLLALVVLQFTQLENDKAGDLRELQELRQERARLEDEKRHAAQAANTPPPAPATTPQAPDPEVVAMKAELERLRAEREAAAVEEARELLAQPDPAQLEAEEKRRGFINRAILVATVENYLPDQGFLMLNVKDFGNAAPDSQLAIRRNGGIAGRVTIVSTDDIGGTAIAEPVAGSFFEGDIVINAGDELIVPPR